MRVFDVMSKCFTFYFLRYTYIYICTDVNIHLLRYMQGKRNTGLWHTGALDSLCVFCFLFLSLMLHA